MGNNGFKYDVRVAAYIEKKDPDNPSEKRILTVTEDYIKYVLPGGKVDNLENIPGIRDKIKDWLKEKGEVLEGVLNKKDLYELKDQKWLLDIKKLRDVLGEELYDELGISCNTDPAIRRIEQFSVLVENLYSKSILLHPIYKVKIDSPDGVRARINLLDKRKREVKELKWASISEMMSKEEGPHVYSNSIKKLAEILYERSKKEVDLPEL